MGEFSNSVVVITGAAGNLGRATAEAFAREGARLALLDRGQDALDDLVRDLPGPGTSKGFAVDLLDANSVNSLAERVQQELGPARVLANIAGGFRMGPKIHQTPDSDWDLMLNLNLRSVFYCCRAFIPQMLAQGGGRVVSVSARAAREGKSKMGPYCAAKAGVITLTESLAAEYKFDGININCILPGTIDTPQNRLDMPDADYQKWVQPAALADVVLFLASDAARAVTGAALPVYGQS